MRIALMQGVDGLSPEGAEWDRLATAVHAERPDILVTNEMPFGPWLARSDALDLSVAAASVSVHERGLEALGGLNLSAVLSSRPVLVTAGRRLANEAFALVNGEYRVAHHKHYFPAEPGFYETAWFTTDQPGFDVVEACGIEIGFLLCTEIFFNERARHYRRQGAQLIAVPRASGEVTEHWRTALAMAAIVSGCYVVSSNRVGQTSSDLTFGGVGLAFAPDGSLIAQTSVEHPVVAFELDPSFVAEQQTRYPCYVSEITIA